MQNTTVDGILDRHNGWIDSLLASFKTELTSIIHAAQMRTQARLREELAVTDGVIDLTIQNSRKLRKLDTVFLEELDRAGLQHLIRETVARFPGQLPYFNEILEAVGAPAVKFGPKDLRVFQDQALSAGDSLQSTVESAAALAKNRVLFTFNGLPFKKLVDVLIESTGKSVSSAVRTAETATVVYFRTISDRGYQIIEAGRSPAQGALRYLYEGPLDKITRPFCARLLMKRNAYTRAEIDGMNNGQLPNVFLTCGGYSCRHQWIVEI